MLAGAGASSGDLVSRQQSLQQSISADSAQIGAYNGRLEDLQARIAGLQSSLAIQQAELRRVRAALEYARELVAQLRAQLIGDRQALAGQLVAQYESPAPDIVGVALQAHGFTDLLSQVTQMQAIARENASAIVRVARDRARVQRQVMQLAGAEIRRQRVTEAIAVERDQVASLQLAVLDREHRAIGDRNRKQSELRQVERQMAAQAAAAQRAAAAQAAASPQAASTGGVAPSGDSGFFPAPGTNYTMGEEPAIAARLNTLGKALGLHLIGLSGYRSPQHSVEVGGFADDPHTRGEASDTPGVEGVPEATLERFGLTRPFPGAAEADHIQLA